MYAITFAVSDMFTGIQHIFRNDNQIVGLQLQIICSQFYIMLSVKQRYIRLNWRRNAGIESQFCVCLPMFRASPLDPCCRSLNHGWWAAQISQAYQCSVCLSYFQHTEVVSRNDSIIFQEEKCLNESKIIKSDRKTLKFENVNCISRWNASAVVIYINCKKQNWTTVNGYRKTWT